MSLFILVHSDVNPRSLLFPYTTLFRSVSSCCQRCGVRGCAPGHRRERAHGLAPRSDRKSTRLNSSHTVISYAVFCLKKKNIYSVVECDSILVEMSYQQLPTIAGVA